MDYQITLWVTTCVSMLLLILSGTGLDLLESNKSNVVKRRVSLILLGVAVVIALLVGLPVWLPVPEVNDNLNPWSQVFVLCTLLGSSLTLLILSVISRPRQLLVAVPCAAITLVLCSQLPTVSALLQATGAAGPVWLLYATPFAVAGGVLAWTFKTARWRYALYVSGWFVIMTMLVLPLYLTVMNAPLYNVYNLSTAQQYNEQFAETVRQASQAQVQISTVYFLAALLLLMLPSLLANRRPSRREGNMSVARVA
ncbi:MAG TPA: hypothetical protein VF914_19295 [Chloroflexia bacterium]